MPEIAPAKQRLKTGELVYLEREETRKILFKILKDLKHSCCLHNEHTESAGGGFGAHGGRLAKHTRFRVTLSLHS